MAEETPETTSDKKKEVPPLLSEYTSNLAPLLEQLKLTILISTYQAGKLIAVRSEGGRINTHFRDFEVPMGMALRNNRLAIGTKKHVWEFHNQPDVAPRLKNAIRPHDACYMPRHRHLTGHIAIHEMAWAGPELWIVNTRFSCLCTLAVDCSFVPRWRPPFITALALEDRCHLNGLATRDDQVQFVTALGTSNEPNGWRETKANGGILMDVPSNSIICKGLSMPHSPRWYESRLWVLESGAGSISVVNEFTGKLDHVALLPGFTRGLDFFGPYAFIGLSQVRETAVFSGIPITERLKPEERSCGLWIVDLRNGQTVAFLKFTSGVQEIFAIQVLPGIEFPEILIEGVQDELLESSYVVPNEVIPEMVIPPRLDAEAEESTPA